MSTPCADDYAGFAVSYRFGEEGPARREANDMVALSSRCREAMAVAVRRIGEIRRGRRVMFVPAALAFSAFWCVIGVGAGLMRPDGNNPSAARAGEVAANRQAEAVPVLKKQDRMPAVPFEARFLVVPPRSPSQPDERSEPQAEAQPEPRAEKPREMSEDRPVPTPRQHQPEHVARRDICARHHMRKVWVTDRRWRCRK